MDIGCLPVQPLFCSIVSPDAILVAVLPLRQNLSKTCYDYNRILPTSTMEEHRVMTLQLPLITSSEPAAFKSTNKASPSDNTSFRVRGVPTDWGREQLQSFLKSQENGLDVSIKSLAIEAGEQYQSATVTFTYLPLRLQKHPQWDIVVPETFNAMAAGEQYLSIDKDFYGLTTLFAPPPRDHKIE